MTLSITVGCDRLADRRQEPDGRSRRFNREPTGSAALWSLGRHATLAGWTPAIPFQYPIPRPQPADTARQCQRAGNPRSACRCCRCSRPLPAPAGRRTLPRLPARFQRAGGGALPPLRHRAVGGPFFAGAKNDLRLPRQHIDPVGWVRLAGLRLDAWPHSCGVAPNPGCRPGIPAPYD